VLHGVLVEYYYYYYSSSSYTVSMSPTPKPNERLSHEFIDLNSSARFKWRQLVFLLVKNVLLNDTRSPDPYCAITTHDVQAIPSTHRDTDVSTSKFEQKWKKKQVIVNCTEGKENYCSFPSIDLDRNVDHNIHFFHSIIWCLVLVVRD
jgi:hypothetical protein